MMETVTITTAMIQLDQFLKWASILQSGGEIRFLLDEKKIFVNGNLCTAKRKNSIRETKSKLKVSVRI